MEKRLTILRSSHQVLALDGGLMTLFKKINEYVKSRDTSCWFLIVAGIVLISVNVESAIIHNEVSPSGGHHGDVAGGIALLAFQFKLSLFILAFAISVALLTKSKSPIVGAIYGLLSIFPIEIVLGIFSYLLWRLAPWLAEPFPYLVGSALIVFGLVRKPKSDLRPI